MIKILFLKFLQVFFTPGLHMMNITAILTNNTTLTTTMQQQYIEQIGLTIMLLICVQEMLSSSLSGDTGYPY
jgi:hypothetical protein